MDTGRLQRLDEWQWVLPAQGDMRVPGMIFGDAELLEAMDEKVLEQVANVAALPGIVKASMAMPDAHWGYGFPIGGVAAFDPEEGGVVSAGGVGFDISCGVRTILTDLTQAGIERYREKLAESLFRTIPAGVGSRGRIRLSDREIEKVLAGGARWAVERGYGNAENLERIEDGGRIEGAEPDYVSARARQRQRDQMGTLGSGNHYLEVQVVAEIYDRAAAQVYGLERGRIVVSIHCGSRGLGHQIASDYLKEMSLAAQRVGIRLPERELACAPLKSDVGRRYLGAMRAGINCALANRQILMHLAEKAIREVIPDCRLDLLYDVSHNTCKEEEHDVGGRRCRVFVHRKGATRAWGPGHPGLPAVFRPVGQPVLVGGSMGSASFIMAGMEQAMGKSFGSAIHGAGRVMSRNRAARAYRGEEIIRRLGEGGIIIRSRSMRGVAEEAPGAYKEIEAVVAAAEGAGLARRVARVEPLIVVKG